MKLNKDFKNKAGIYRIHCGDRDYIGSSKNLYNRLAVHFSQLRGNYHHSIFMQRVFNKYGEENFNFEILETIEYNEEELRKLEEKYMNEYSGDFNSTTPRTYNHSKEMRKKISNTLKERYKNGEINNPRLNTGRKITLYNKYGNIVKENILVKKCVEFLNLSNRSVINNLIRHNRYIAKKKYIVISEEESFEDYIKYIYKQKGRYIPAFKVFDNKIERCSSASKEYAVDKILKNNLCYYGNKNKCYYTFLGLINKMPYYEETHNITTEQKR